MILANLLALASADAHAASVVMGFADGAVDRLVGVDGVRETAVALVAVGDAAAPPQTPGPLPELHLPTEPLSPREVRYPEIEEAHRASSFASGDEAATWRARTHAAVGEAPGPLSNEPIAEVIRRRRSARRFADRSITRSQLVTALAAAVAPIPGDSFGADLVAPFVIVTPSRASSRARIGMT